MAWRYERRPLASLGLIVHKVTMKELFIGAAFGVLLASLALLLSLSLGTVEAAVKPWDWGLILRIFAFYLLDWLGGAPGRSSPSEATYCKPSSRASVSGQQSCSTLSSLDFTTQ